MSHSYHMWNINICKSPIYPNQADDFSLKVAIFPQLTTDDYLRRMSHPQKKKNRPHGDLDEEKQGSFGDKNLKVFCFSFELQNISKLKKQGGIKGKRRKEPLHLQNCTVASNKYIF